MRILALLLAFCAACGPVEEADVAGGSIFPHGGRRQVLQNQSAAQNFVDVATVDEFIAALGALPGVAGNCYGKGINVVAPLHFTASIRLGEQHAGLTITSPSRANITTAAAASPWMLIETRNVEVRSLRLAAGFNAPIVFSAETNAVGVTTIRDITIDPAAALTTFIQLLPDPASLGARLFVVGNRCESFRTDVALLQGVSGIGGGLFGARIADNVNFAGAMEIYEATRSTFANNDRLGTIFQSGLTGTDGASVYAGNIMQGDILLTDSGNNVISGNVMQGNDINTTGSVGATGNTITGNTNVGTITKNAGDDDTGGNT